MSPEPAARLIPWSVKIGFTAFMAVLVPIYWSTYGPTNFLYFCDVALFLALASVWTERPVYASMAAVGILLPQTLWVIDFLGTLVGFPLVGMTGYMFDPNLPLFARGLSFFHFWLPFFLVYLVWRLGYDRRALAAWTALAILLILTCYLWLPAPPALNPDVPVNVNYVYGLSDQKPQEWMPARMWVLTLLIGLPTLIYLPTHGALRFLFTPQTRLTTSTGSAITTGA